MNQFLGIQLLSGYHSVPSERDFWSTQPDLHVPLVTETMTLNRYKQIKSNLHLADNHNLEVGNKVAKVLPIYSLLNKNLQQFGIFHSLLSIDESMVPYYGRHSSKMFIRMKPIRCGYKLWILSGSDGYPYAIRIYTGASPTKRVVPLGFSVVNDLLELIKETSNPAKHTVFFDNFFSSYDLFRHLHKGGFKATGTIRSNRSGGAHKSLKSDGELKKAGRGSYDYRCNGYVFVCKWNDSAVVSVASNYCTHLPENKAARRVGKEIIHVPQSWYGRCRPS
jgi:hypothetical protein